MLLVKFFKLKTFLTRENNTSNNINSGSKSQTKVQHLMSVSNFLVVKIPTEKVSFKQLAINEVQKKLKA